MSHVDDEDNKGGEPVAALLGSTTSVEEEEEDVEAELFEVIQRVRPLGESPSRRGTRRPY